MNIDDLEVLQQELYDDGWEYATEYVLRTAKYGYWQREVLKKDGSYKAYDIYYNDGIEDFDGPFSVYQLQVTTFTRS